jgi:hypothetical protein
VSVYLSRLEARRHDHENPDFRLALTLLRDVLEGNWPWGDRHEHEIRQRRSPKADVAQYFYPRWTKIVNLVEEALQSAAADPRKLHELARDQVSPDVAERTQRAVLLAILWAVHNRLEHVRRAA